MASYPAELPKFLLAGYSEKAPATVARTEMDAGEAKQRRRYTAAVRPITAAIDVKTKALLLLFDDWFVNDLAGGAIRFDYEDPIREETVQLRFIAGSEPQYVPQDDPEQWRIEMNLEMLP